MLCYDQTAHQARVLCCIIDTNFIPQYFLESGHLTNINNKNALNEDPTVAACGSV